MGLSLIATSVSANTFLLNPGESYGHGLRLFFHNRLAEPLSVAIVLWVFIPLFLRSGHITAYGWLEDRFGPGARALASGCYSLHLVLRCGIVMAGGALLFQQLTGLSPAWSVVIVGLVSIAYTWLGGLRAIVWTDVVQFIVLLGGGLAIMAHILWALPGGWEEVWTHGRDQGLLRLWDFDAPVFDPRGFASAALAYLVLDLALRATDQQFVQRYRACGGAAGAARASIAALLLGIVTAALFFGLGICLSAYVARTGFGGGALRPDDVLPRFIVEVLPAGLKGLVVAGVFAAAMSSLDSALGALSATMSLDLYRRFLAPEAGEEAVLRFAQATVLAVGAFGIAAGIWAVQRPDNLLLVALGYTALFTGVLLGLFVLGLVVKRADGRAACWGAILGLATLPVTHFLVDRAPEHVLPGVWNAPLGLIGTLAWGTLLSYIPGLRKHPP